MSIYTSPGVLFQLNTAFFIYFKFLIRSFRISGNEAFSFPKRAILLVRGFSRNVCYWLRALSNESRVRIRHEIVGLTFGIKELDWSCDPKRKVTLVVSLSAGFIYCFCFVSMISMVKFIKFVEL